MVSADGLGAFRMFAGTGALAGNEAKGKKNSSSLSACECGPG